MTELPTLLILSLLPGTCAFKADGLHIDVQVRGNVYTYEISNMGRTAIQAVEIPFADGCAFVGPAGWSLSTESGMLRAEAGDSNQAIRPAQSAIFSFRTTSRGGVLGRVTVTVQTDSGTTIQVPGVWSIVDMPASFPWFVAGLVLLLAGLYAGAGGGIWRKLRRMLKAA